MKKIRKSEVPIVPIMFGLDPAKPWFAKRPLAERLDKTDAIYVEVNFITNSFKRLNSTYSST